MKKYISFLLAALLAASLLAACGEAVSVPSSEPSAEPSAESAAQPEPSVPSAPAASAEPSEPSDASSGGDPESPASPAGEFWSYPDDMPLTEMTSGGMEEVQRMMDRLRPPFEAQTVGDEEVHRILLGAEVAVLEGLDLRGAPAGEYILCALPVKLGGSDGAPVRAVLFEREEELWPFI